MVSQGCKKLINLWKLFLGEIFRKAFIKRLLTRQNWPWFPYRIRFLLLNLHPIISLLSTGNVLINVEKEEDHDPSRNGWSSTWGMQWYLGRLSLLARKGGRSLSLQERRPFLRRTHPPSRRGLPRKWTEEGIIYFLYALNNRAPSDRNLRP